MERRKNRKPTIEIIDPVSERCLREEGALDKALVDKGIYAYGMSNYGEGFIARSGIPNEKLPCIEIEDLTFFPPHPGEELTYEKLCVFLDIMVSRKILLRTVDAERADESIPLGLSSAGSYS